MGGTAGTVVRYLFLLTGLVPAHSTVRLSDGPTSSEGRLEVYYNGEWGTVCDDGFGRREALVACKELGFQGVETFSSNEYPTDSGQIWLDDVSCDGSESSIVECSHSGWGIENCGHIEDVNLVCGTSTITVRLSDGPTSSEGRLEVYYIDEWGTVCDDGFGQSEAKAFCRMLGFTGAITYTSNEYSRDSGQIWLDNISCDGYESSINQCSHDGWGNHDCYHSQDVNLICESDLMTVRLIDGPTATEGRLEVNYEGEWGTVCDDGFGESEAQVFCRLLGFKDAVSHSTNTYSTLMGEIWLDEVTCDGKESSIDECLHDGWGKNDCSHDEDVNLVCTSEAPGVSWVTIAVPIVVVVALVVVCSTKKKSTRPVEATGTSTNSITKPAASSSSTAKSIEPQPRSQRVSTITNVPPAQSQYPSGTPYTHQRTGPHMNIPAPGIRYHQGGQINHGYAPSPSGQPYPQMPKTPAGPPPGRLAPVTHTQQTPSSNGMTPVGDSGEIDDLPPPPSYNQLFSTNAQPGLPGPPN